jgi:glycosyltransferase involved in cell wall biosynthesis
LRVTFLWWTFEGYMTACWRELASRPGMEVAIIALRPDITSQAPFQESLLHGLNYELHDACKLHDAKHVVACVAQRRPDVMVVPGWFIGSFRTALLSHGIRACRVMAIDTPLQHTLRQAVGRWWYRRLFRQLDAVVVAGDRAAALARYLGIEDRRIHRPMYGHDFDRFAPCYQRRLALGAWPRQFLFVGRYAEEKGIGVLLEAYARYRSLSRDPWALACCGRGPLQRALHPFDRGFVQPAELGSVFTQSGCLILPSLFEPWGVVVAEACAAGLPVLCTDACGAAPELVGGNGKVVRAGDGAALAEAMHWIEQHEHQLPGMGLISQNLARRFSPRSWADQWERMLRECCRA